MSLADTGESGRFGWIPQVRRILLIRLDRADSGEFADSRMPADSFIETISLFREIVLNDATPAFRGLISWIEVSSRFAAPGDVSRIVSSNQEPTRGISQRIRREREMTANKRSALSLRCDDDWKLGVASRSKRERVIRSL